jgi:hypothetical protein
VAQIDAPLLDKFVMTFFQQHIFDTAQLTQFITRTPKLKAHYEARVAFSYREALVSFSQTHEGVLESGISCRQPDLQVSSLAQLCSSSFPGTLIPAVETLHILEDKFPPFHWPDNIESSQWLELLHPFTAVRVLFIYQKFVPRIAPTLQELVGERVTEVLPALQTLYLEEAIVQFVATRELAGHPIVTHYCELEGDW